MFSRLIFACLILLIIVLVISVESISACSCGASLAIYEEFENADAVFTGKVVSLEEVKEKEKNGDEEIEFIYHIFHFQVIESLKGITGKTVKVGVGERSNSCYHSYTIGQSYLIYANGEGDSFGTGFCDRSVGLLGAKGEIQIIREILQGKPEPQIYGEVFKSENDPQTNERKLYGLAGFKVFLLNKETGQKIETLTDEFGIFRFYKVIEGSYQVKIDSEQYKFETFSETVKVLPTGKVVNKEIWNSINFNEGFNSAFVSISAVWKNKITGRLLDGEGKPVKRAAIELLPLKKANTELINFDENETDNLFDGDFSLTAYTPGLYLLVADIYAPFEKKERTRVFHSKTVESKKAQVVMMKEDTELNLDLHLPEFLITRKIVGKVIGRDGKPVENVSVYLKRLENTKSKTNWLYDEDDSKADGTFSLEGFENAEYWIYATDTDDEGENEIITKPIKIKVGKINKPIKLTFPSQSNKANSN